MRIYIVIPAHNEESHLEKMLESLVNQTVLPDRVVMVNDASTDRTEDIIRTYAQKFPFITYVNSGSEKTHQPGAKVVEAFYIGLNQLDDDFDLLGKFDADLVFPSDYLEKMKRLFLENPNVGMGSGILYIATKNGWEFENISSKDKVRGPIKLYRKKCFSDIGGLKKSIGWDTVDELLARFHGWEVKTDYSAIVKHLKPTGQAYTPAARFKQGEAFHRMRYGCVLTVIALAKLALKRKRIGDFFEGLKGYYKAKRAKLDFIVSEEEGRFIRKYRWRGILSKAQFVQK